jgi:hypothetical protein
MPELLKQTAEKAGQILLLNMDKGFDHSYYFISSSMAIICVGTQRGSTGSPVDLGNYRWLWRYRLMDYHIGDVGYGGTNKIAFSGGPVPSFFCKTPGKNRR